MAVNGPVDRSGETVTFNEISSFQPFREARRQQRSFRLLEEVLEAGPRRKHKIDPKPDALAGIPTGWYVLA